MFNNIPKNWTKTKLEMAANIEYGTRIVKNSSVGSKYYVYGGGDKTFKTDEYNRENALVIARFGMSPKCTRFVKGKFFLNDSGLTVSTNNEEILDQEFLNWQLIFLNDLIYSLGKGVAQKNLNVGKFKQIDIIIPPTLKEQKEIVEILKTMNTIISLREKCIKDAQNLIPAMFQEMFASYITKKADYVPIGSVTNDTTQINPSKIFKSEFYYIDISSINNDTGIIETPKKININNIPSRARKIVQTNDVLISMTRPYLKGFSIVPEYLNGQIASTGFSVLRAIPEKLSPLYLNAYTKTNLFIEQLIPKMKGASYPAVRDLDVRNVKIPLPSIELQEQFAERIEEINSYIQTQQKELENAKQMFQSLLYHAFTGELTRRVYGKD